MDKIEELLTNAKSAASIGAHEKAISLCETVLENESSNIEALTVAGISCIARNEANTAEVYFARAISAEPQDGELQFLLGNAIFGQQRISEALQYYANAERFGCSDESRKKLYYLMGLINQVQGQPMAALVNYKKSLKIPGTNLDQVDIFLKCTQLCVESQKFDEAENYARQIKLLKPEEFKSYELLFQILLQVQMVDEAFSVLQEAEDACLEECNADIALYRALLHSVLAEIESDKSTEHHDNALKLLDRLDLSGISPVKQLEVTLSKAEIYLKLNDVANGKKLAEKVLSFSRTNDMVDYFDKAHFILLECLKSENDFSNALPHAEALKKSANGFYRCHGMYSVALLTRELKGLDAAKIPYAEAIAFYRASTAQNPADMIAYSYRIRAYADTGEKNKAIELCAVLPDSMRTEMEGYINGIHS